MARRQRSGDYFHCPHCGGKVAVGASFCRHCGADEGSGWSDDTQTYAEGNYDEDDFDYDEYLAREFPESAPTKRPRPHWLIVLVVAAICLAMLLATVL
jgi:hypothetical protein